MKIQGNKFYFVLFALQVAISLPPTLLAQQEESKHHCDMVARGNKAMGFDAAKTTHHFSLSPAGGAIEVTANDAGDTASRDEIRAHLQHIALKFQDGDFEIPMYIHDQVPPGVPLMKKLKGEITYKYVSIEQGGRIMISTANAEAISAVHDFLRFQIEEHHTGDKP